MLVNHVGGGWWLKLRFLGRRPVCVKVLFVVWMFLIFCTYYKVKVNNNQGSGNTLGFHYTTEK